MYSSSSSNNHLTDFHGWLQRKRETKVSFLPWVRTLLNDETLMGMKWDDFIGKPRPIRAGKKLDAFNALFILFSKERNQESPENEDRKIIESGEKKEEVIKGKENEREEDHEEEKETVGNLTEIFNESLSLHAQNEEERPSTPPPPPPSSFFAIPSTPSIQSSAFFVKERMEVLSVISWNTHNFRFFNQTEQMVQMAAVLGQYALILLQEIPSGLKARDNLQAFCSVLGEGEEEFAFLLPETAAAASTSLNAILFRTDAWDVIHSTSLQHHAHPPMLALLKRKEDGLKVFVASLHVSPTIPTATPSKLGSRSTASRELVQNRIYSDLTEITTVAQRWGCYGNNNGEDEEALVFLVAGDFNELPLSSITADLRLHPVLPPFFPTAIQTKRTLDNFVLAAETLKIYQPSVDLIHTNASDHFPITLSLKKYPRS